MKKILSLVLITLSVVSFAQADYLIPGRGHGHEPRPQVGGGGHLIPGAPGGGTYPGGGSPYPGQPIPDVNPNYPNGPYPEPTPAWGDLYGPPRTVRWEDKGSFRVEKLIDTNVNLSARQQYVNEIFVVVDKNNVEVKSAMAYMANGQPVELRSMLGNLRPGQYRLALDYRNSLRIDRIEIEMRSNLIGSRANVSVQLGLAF